MYRIVVADSRAPRDGAFVEIIGHYQPLVTPSTIVIDAERARHWLDHGAQPSDRVAKLLAIQGIAELPAKLKARIELGQQRAKEAAKAKPKAEAPPAEATAGAEPAGEAPPAAETPAEEAPAPEEQSAEPEATAGEEEKAEG
jgi:small subunit ribosomal protein S16